MKWRKVTALSATAAMVMASLAGCGGSSSAAPAASEPASSAPVESEAPKFAAISTVFS